jgi:RND family efflux transporter MFP subunit
MKSDFDQAKSALELAQSNLDKCKLTAPVNGLVGRRNIEPGQSSISLAMAPLELVRIDNVLVKISVPENEINKISAGQDANAGVAALGGKVFTGEVTHISPVAEMISRTYTVKISVNNPDRDLKPGMVCDVSLAQGPADNLLLVPSKAVSRDSEGNTFVYIVNSVDLTVNKQAVSVGRYLGSGIEITGGLAEGQVIVCEGMEKLYDNCKIGL